MRQRSRLSKTLSRPRMARLCFTALVTRIIIEASLRLLGRLKPCWKGPYAAAAAAAKLIDLRVHKGVHPRLGALDVLPFVPVRGATLEDCITLAHRAGERIWRELSVPVYLYEAAARQPIRQRLENVRRGEFERSAKPLW